MQVAFVFVRGGQANAAGVARGGALNGIEKGGGALDGTDRRDRPALTAPRTRRAPAA